jgi:acyl carrier protein
VAHTVRAEALDCLQTGIALVADAAHGPGTHLRLGSRCGFTVRPGGGLAANARARLAEAEALLGLRVTRYWQRLLGPRLRQLAAARAPLYVVADAFHLPWCPYAGRQHMDHSLLVVEALPDQVTVVDAYHNDTAWGAARPGVWRLTPTLFDACFATGADAYVVTPGPLPAPDPAADLAANAVRWREVEPAVHGYLARARAGMTELAAVERMVLDIWLLSRERRLHAAWLADQESPMAGAWTDHAEEWQRLAAQSYVVLTRVRHGRPAGPAIVDRLGELLAADAAWAAKLAAAASTTPGTASTTAAEPAASVREAVVDALSRALSLPKAEVAGAEALRDLPNFNSFRLVEVIDEVERRLGLEVPPDELGASHLRDVAGLCRLFAAAGGPR